MNTNTPQTLSTAPFAHPTLDYAWLRATAIRQLERLTGGQWTDFNAHDPGITILEQVCYALTDLSYRIDYDLQDLLTGDEAEPYRDLFTPATILTTNPVTLTDLRKVVLDVTGVRNAWIAPQETVTPPIYYDPADQSLYVEAGPQRQLLALRGVYQVLVAADRAVDGVAVDEVTLRNAVTQRLHACRNLGETFDLRILPQQRITVQATLEVAALDDPDQVLATVYQVLDDFLAPRIRFHTLADLLAQGQPIDEIMDGPRLAHGFIVTEELAALTGPRTGLRASDLIQEIMNVAGVRAVNTITLTDGITSDGWYLPLDPTRTPILDFDQSLRAGQPAIQLVRHGLAVSTNSARVDQIWQARQRAARPTPSAAQLDLTLPAGRKRQVARYYPIQQQLPALYGLGAAGLPASASAERQAQVKQLQAYLLFFDQLLANAFAQVAHVKDLFACDGTARPSYFAQPLDDPALGLADIWVQSDAATRAARLQTLTEEAATALARKHRFLNHLLARFGETFTEFDFARNTPDAALSSKAAFLQAYPEMSGARGRAFDITQPAAAHQGFPRSTLEQRLNHKLGLAAVQPPALATLAANDPGGFYLVEHILLRPEATDPVATALAPGEVGWQAGALLALPNQTARPDPYSQQLTFVLPDWITRFKAADFQAFLLQTLREETPAHLAVQLLPLNQAEMAIFDTLYQTWRATLLPTTNDPERIAARAARDGMIDWLGLGAPYPLRDLPLAYVAMVAVDQPAAIQLQDAQPGVSYRLCDEEGNPLDETPAITVDWQAPPAPATLTTPKITADRTFTILATRAHTARGQALTIPLETYLKQSVSIKAGINTGLDVEFFVGEQRLDADNPAPIDYNAMITAKVKQSQAGISYQLVEGEGQSQTARSPVVAGDQNATITLTSTPLAEDTEIKIRAYRPSGANPGPDSSNSAAVTDALLKRTIALKVRPNPAVAVRITPPIVDYQEQVKLTLVGAQPSVTYQIYQRLLNANEYATNDQAPDTLRLAGEEGRIISIKAPPPISDWNQPAPFAPGSLFAVDANGAPTATLTDLREDSYVIVRATKTVNQASLALKQVVVILVRPDQSPAVGAEPPADPTANAGVVTVNQTQQGVAYQLLAGEKPINEPGYHYRDRAIETMRVEVDFIVKILDDANADQTLRLPTGPLTEETTFTVQATKVYTGLRARLTGEVTITVDPPPSTPPAATEPTTRAVAPTVADLLVSAETGSLSTAENVAVTAAGPDVSPEQAVVDFNQSTRIRIKASRAREWYQLWLAGAPLGDAVKGTGRDRLLETPRLRADARFELHITQPAADPPIGERIIAVVVLVRPDPTLAVSALDSAVAANRATAIQVAASQVGVQYQLWAGAQPMGEVVAGNGATITLPTGPLTAETSFVIRATRLDQADLSVDLAQGVTVQVV